MTTITFKPVPVKQLFCLLLLGPACFLAEAQTTTTVKELKEKLGALPLAVEETKYKSLANLVLNDPRIYNGIWNKVYNSIRDKKDQPLLKNLKITQGVNIYQRFMSNCIN